MGARPVRRPDARARRRSLLRPGPARRGARRERGGPAAADRARRVGVRRRHRPRRAGPRALGKLAAGRAGPAPHRRPDRRRVRPRPGRAREVVADRRGARRRVDVHPAAAAELAVHARLVVLDLRRRLDQPDVLAGPPPRGVQHGRDLPGPPDVRGRRLRVLVPADGRRRPVQRSTTSGWRRSRAATSRSSAGARSRSGCRSGRPAG